METMEYKEELRRVLYQFRDLWCQNIDLETINEFVEQEVANKNFVLSDVIGSLPLIEFIEEVEYMMKLYGNQRYTQAEAQRDKLAEKLDDIMRLGGNGR